MKVLKPVNSKTSKNDRERQVLIILVEHYIKTGKPVGSNTLKEIGFANLSSATIRNYFAHLEEEGFLVQQHISGGRIPTDKAYRLYANEYIDSPIQEIEPTLFENLRTNETREIASFLQKSADQLKEITKTAVFLSAPRFEQDFLIDIKLVPIDSERCLCVLITDFGEIITETLSISQKLTSLLSNKVENYFKWRLTGQNKPVNINNEEEKFAQEFYNELMVRYIVRYSNFNHEEIYRTGFSTFLNYPEFHDSSLLATSLALFENTQGMRLLLTECCKLNRLKVWIGDDLHTYAKKNHPNCSVLAIPYYVNKQPVGAIGLLGPTRLPYRYMFSLLTHYAENISESLTRNLYKFKITMRQPKADSLNLNQPDLKLIGLNAADQGKILIEDKRHPQSSKQVSRRK